MVARSANLLREKERDELWDRKFDKETSDERNDLEIDFIFHAVTQFPKKPFDRVFETSRTDDAFDHPE